MLGQKLAAVFPQPSEIKTPQSLKALLICEILESVLGTQQPNTALTQANSAPSTTDKDSAGRFIHHATVQAFFTIDLPHRITIKTLSQCELISTQKIMSFIVPGPISEVPELP